MTNKLELLGIVIGRIKTNNERENKNIHVIVLRKKNYRHKGELTSLYGRKYKTKKFRGY